MFQALFSRYKSALLNMLYSYCSKNNELIDVHTTEEDESITVTVTLERSLFSDEQAYAEIIEALEKIGEVKRK